METFFPDAKLSYSNPQLPLRPSKHSKHSRKKKFSQPPPKAACCFKLYISLRCASFSSTFLSFPLARVVFGCCTVLFAAAAKKPVAENKIKARKFTHTPVLCRLSSCCLTCGRKSSPENIAFFCRSQTNLLNFINLAMTTRHIFPHSFVCFWGIGSDGNSVYKIQLFFGVIELRSNQLKDEILCKLARL